MLIRPDALADEIQARGKPACVPYSYGQPEENQPGSWMPEGIQCWQPGEEGLLLHEFLYIRPLVCNIIKSTLYSEFQSTLYSQVQCLLSCHSQGKCY